MIISSKKLEEDIRKRKREVDRNQENGINENKEKTKLGGNMSVEMSVNNSGNITRFYLLRKWICHGEGRVKMSLYLLAPPAFPPWCNLYIYTINSEIILTPGKF